MNERIKELFIEAYGYAPMPLEDHIPIEVEKFADLILRECLARIEGCNVVTTQQVKPYTEFEQGYDKAVSKVYSQVKLHFGVK